MLGGLFEASSKICIVTGHQMLQSMGVGHNSLFLRRLAYVDLTLISDDLCATWSM